MPLVWSPALGPFIYEDGNTLAATEAQAGMHAAYLNVQAEGAAWIARNGSDYFTGARAVTINRMQELWQGGHWSSLKKIWKKRSNARAMISRSTTFKMY